MRLTSIYLFIFLIALYLLTASSLNFYEIGATQVQLKVIKSLVERCDLSVPKEFGIKGVDGRCYAQYGIGFVLLGIPFYALGNLINAPEIAITLMGQIAGAATAVVVFLFSGSLGYSRRACLFTAISYGLCTIAWPFAKQPYDHVIETFFVLLSIYFMYRYIPDRKAIFVLLSGAFIGIAVVTRITSIVVVPALFILILFRRLTVRDILLFSLAFLPFMALSLWYDYYRFGSIFETGYQIIATRTGIPLFNGSNLATGLAGLLVSPGKGFFYYSPVAVLFFFSIKPFLKRHLSVGLFFILITIAYLLFFSSYTLWHGDVVWGPRYLLVITPFLIIPIVELFESDIWVKKTFLKTGLTSIIAVSFIIQLAAISVDSNKYFFDLRYKDNVPFVEGQVNDTVPIFAPSNETYFDWHRSPILAQFRYVYEIAIGMKHYRYSKPSANVTFIEKLGDSPVFNVFDFWWLYNYYGTGSYSGFIGALLLLAVAVHYGLKLKKSVVL